MAASTSTAGVTGLIAEGNLHWASTQACASPRRMAWRTKPVVSWISGVAMILGVAAARVFVPRPSRRHDRRRFCGELIGVDPVIAAAIVKRPDTHSDIDGRANTMTVMAPKRGDDEMLLLCLQAREPRFDR